jgi:glycosyltransferase involved in cell wall biosynthesis
MIVERSKKRMKILQVVHSLDAGGIEHLVFELSNRLNHNEFSLHICCVGGDAGLLAPDLDPAISVHVFGHYRKNPARFFFGYKSLLRRERYDVIHCHLNHFSWLFFAWCKQGSPRHVAHYHNDFSSVGRFSGNPLKGRLSRGMSRHLTQSFADRVLGISVGCLSSVYGVNWQKNSKASVLYNGVDIGYFGSANQLRNTVRRRLGIQDSKVVFGHVGRFRVQKNHQFIVELAASLASKTSQFIVLLVGDGPQMDEIKALVRAKRLESFFMFVGVTTDVRAMLSAMDVFLYPSLWEGVPLALIEAQASGLPVMISDSITEEIPLVPPGVRLSLDAVEPWVDLCVQWMTASSDRTQRVEEAGRQLSLFDIDTWTASLREVYRSFAPV